MSVLKKITGSLSTLSNALAQNHLAEGYCKGPCQRCGRETRWAVHLTRGYFRCTECGNAPEQEEQ